MGKGGSRGGHGVSVARSIDPGKTQNVMLNLFQHPARATPRAETDLIQSQTLPGTTIITDEFGSSRHLDACRFDHKTVSHKAGQYVNAQGHGVNAIEGFWALLKRGINGTHIHVSRKHLPKYLGEFEYRWNMRRVPRLILDRLMYSFAG
jgi:hypothetical protein